MQEKFDHLDAWDLDSRLDMAMDALRCPPGETTVASPEGKSGGWRFAGFSCKSRIFCCSMSRPTTWMPKRWPGWSTTFRTTPEPSSRSPMTAISSTTWQGGFSSSTGGREFRGRETTLRGSSRRRIASQQEEKQESERRKTLQRELEWIRCRPRGAMQRGGRGSASYEQLLPRRANGGRKIWRFIFRRDRASATSSSRRLTSAKPTAIVFSSRR